MRWQNLNDRPDGTQGPGWRHGRAWLKGIGIEWQFPGRFLSVGYARGGHSLWTVHLSTLLGSIYLHSTKECGVRNPGYFDFSWHYRGFWLTLWGRHFEHRSRDSWVRKTHHFNPIDFIFGKPEYSEEIVKSEEVEIPMPEGRYRATASYERCVWKRPRWFRRPRLYINLRMPIGIPFEGKGENSWDCGEDALYGCGSESWDINKAIGEAVTSVLRWRQKYGTPNRIREMIAARA